MFDCMQTSKLINQLSPTAVRFINIAIRKEGDARNSEEWNSWVESYESETSTKEIPSHVAQIALHALSGLALTIERALADTRVDPGDAVVLENDLGYIADLENFLSGCLFVPFQSAG
jgi:hypothetical protein